MENERKFEDLNFAPEVQMDTIRKNLFSKVKECENYQLIIDGDRLLITEITNNVGMKQSPVFRPVMPYPYPLFKIHSAR